MTLITSQSMKQEATVAKGESIAARDIVRRNSFGQNVVVVPKGQPIPDSIEDVTDEERGTEKKKGAPAENKAARRSTSSKSK